MSEIDIDLRLQRNYMCLLKVISSMLFSHIKWSARPGHQRLVVKLWPIATIAVLGLQDLVPLATAAVSM
jgi:hypothetical protein